MKRAHDSILRATLILALGYATFGAVIYYVLRG